MEINLSNAVITLISVMMHLDYKKWFGFAKNSLKNLENDTIALLKSDRVIILSLDGDDVSQSGKNIWLIETWDNLKVHVCRIPLIGRFVTTLTVNTTTPTYYKDMKMEYEKFAKPCPNIQFVFVTVALLATWEILISPQWCLSPCQYYKL